MGMDTTETHAGTESKMGGRVDINTATAGELADLPGIGATLAARIVKTRNERVADGRSRWARWQHLLNVDGVGFERAAAISGVIFFSGGRSLR